MSEEKKITEAVPTEVKEEKKKTAPKAPAKRKAAPNKTKALEKEVAELNAKLEQATKLIEQYRTQRDEAVAHIQQLEGRYTAITNHIAQNIDLCRANILVAIKEG